MFAKSIGFYINALGILRPKKATKLAYALFSQPRRGKLDKNKMPKTLLKASFESFVCDNETIQTYIWKGNETVIFLIHGWESNSSRWKKMLPHILPTGCTIVAIDGPAHGLSGGKEMTVFRYSQYIDVVAKKYPPSFLIGHSLGGMSCLYYQSTYKNKQLKKIVTLGAPSDFSVIFENFIALLHLNSQIKNSLHQHIQSSFGVDVYNFGSTNFVKNSTSSGFIAHDMQDKVVLIDEAHKIAAAWKNANFIKTKGFGHALHDSNLYEEIRLFLLATDL